MRKDIRLTTVNADISDRSSGRRINATIAFTISYDSPRADQAYKVAEELASLYLAENLRARQQSVAETTAFLAQEADRLAAQIQEIEANLSQFKRRYAGRLPDSSAINMQLADRVASELLRIEREISTLQERKLALEAQLPIVSPHAQPATGAAGERALTPSERLRSLRAQYATASAVYGADHPDLRRMKREIAGLGGEVEAPARDVDAADKLKMLETELVALRERYSEEHPDIQRAKRSIAALKTAGGTQVAAPAAADRRQAKSTIPEPDNPPYIALTTQIEGAKRELNHLSALRSDLQAQQRMYDARLLQIPEVEREYRDLTRDYENAQTRYREVKSKQMQAEVSQELEQNRKAERFSLGEPAHLPERPVSPNRPVIALAGLIAAMGSGLGLAWLREAFDMSVKGPLDLARIATVPVLTPIPYIETHSERVGRRRRAWMAVCLIALLAVAFLLGVHYLRKPWSGVLDSLLRNIPFW
jgi:uncharacterized protein involved in exopolysaccharide biosynthesis